MPDLVGKRALVVPMRLEGADLLAAWMSAPDAQARWFGRPASRAMVLARWPPVMFDDAYPRKGRAFLIESAGAARGAVLYHAMWGKPAHALLELVPGPGLDAALAADALDALVRYLFDGLRAAKAWAELPPGDALGAQAFEAAGFAPRGRTADGLAVVHRARADARRRA